ncbi:MAG: RNA polymerase sigma-70 factor [Chitinophagia bacterium]|jgi:RNA polymerase sigma-70 factor (ECF subfamily)
MSARFNDTDKDAELLIRLQEDDQYAFTSIYNKYWKNLYAVAYSILKDKTICEDIVQDIFINVWNKRKSIAIKVSLKAYLTSSVKYEVFRQLKKKIEALEIVDDLLIDPNNSAQENMEYKELLVHINNVVNKLSTKCREVFILSREKELSHKEIAVIRNISTKTVENHIGKALGSLKDVIGYNILIFLFFTSL